MECLNMRRSVQIAAVALSLAVLPVGGASAAVSTTNQPFSQAHNGDLELVYHRKWHRPHCHRSVQRHYHGSIGRSAWHRHRGDYCRTQVVRRFHQRPRYPGCFRVGPFWFCP
jgi:hypothetical protein